MRFFLLSLFTLSSAFLLAQTSQSFNDLVFGGQDFFYLVPSNEIYQRDGDTTWKKESASHYIGDDLGVKKKMLVKYGSENDMSVTVIYKDRPARVQNTQVRNGKVESVYRCEVDLAAGIFSPSGIKALRCFYVTPAICRELNLAHTEVMAFNSLDPKDARKDLMKPYTENFSLIVASSLSFEKENLLEVYLDTYKFLLETGDDPIKESDLKFESYQSSFEYLCMGVRREFGTKLRFKYGQDLEYEENVCLDHASLLLESERFKQSYLPVCESLADSTSQ